EDLRHTPPPVTPLSRNCFTLPPQPLYTPPETVSLPAAPRWAVSPRAPLEIRNVEAEPRSVHDRRVRRPSAARSPPGTSALHQPDHSRVGLHAEFRYSVEYSG